MSSKRLSKRRDSKFLNVTKEKDLRCHSDNDLTALPDSVAPSAAAAAANGPVPGSADRTGGTPEFGSSCSVQTAGGSSMASSDTHSVSEGPGPGGRGRAESLELGRQARPTFARSSLIARDLHPNGIAGKHRNSGPYGLFGGSTQLLSGSHGLRAGSFLTVQGGRGSQRMHMVRNPEEQAKLLRRYHELREILSDIREQKLAKEAQLQRLLAKERELTSKQSGAGATVTVKKCVPTQFLVAVDTAESEADSALSAELDSVQQQIAVQKSLVDAHIRLLREAKASRQPRHVTKMRAADYQEALEKLSKLNLEMRSIRDRMSNAEQYDDDTISQSSSFAYCNGYASSSAYHSSPRNPGSEYYTESLLSGQLYDTRSHVSDLSRESSILSAASIASSIPMSHVSAPPPSSNRRAPVVGSTTDTAASPVGVVRRRSNLAANAHSGSNWRRSNSMGNLLGDQPEYQQPALPQHQKPSALRAAPTNTSFPPELPPSQPTTYRRTSGADQRSLSYRYLPRPSLEPITVPTPAASGTDPQLHQPQQQQSQAPPLSASHQSPYWYTPRTRLEPAAPLAVHRQQRKQYTSDL